MNSHLLHDLTFGEMFSGIGVGSLAFKEVFPEAKCKFFSEIQPQRVKAYLKNFPDHKNIGNIDFVDIDRLPRVNVLIGGSPCQDLSIARGKREGLDGDQSGLFYKFLDVIRERKPEFFILENVASMRDEDRDEISRCLGVQPVMISSEVFTGQKRMRYYWCNFPILPLPTEKIDPRIHIDKTVKPNEKDLDWDQMHSVYYKEEKVALQKHKSKWDWISWSRSTRYKEFKDLEGFNDWIVKNPNIDYKIKGQGSLCPSKISYVEQRVKINSGANTCVTGKHCARMSAKNYIRHGEMVRQPTVKECLRLQGLPDDFLDGLSESAAYAAIGDSFTLGPIIHILKSLKGVISSGQKTST
jgi:DNA-cytosine methyltransferase